MVAMIVWNFAGIFCFGSGFVNDSNEKEGGHIHY